MAAAEAGYPARCRLATRSRCTVRDDQRPEYERPEAMLLHDDALAGVTGGGSNGEGLVLCEMGHEVLTLAPN